MLEFLDHIDTEALLVVGKAASAALIAMAALIVIFTSREAREPEPEEVTPKWEQTISFNKSDVEDCKYDGIIRDTAKRMCDRLHTNVYKALLTGEPKVEVDRGVGIRDRYTLKPTNVDTEKHLEKFNASFKLPPGFSQPTARLLELWPTPRVTEDLGIQPLTTEAREALISFANNNPDPDAYPGGRLAFDHHARRLTNDHMAEIAETEGRAQAHLLSARSRLSSIRDNVDDLKQFVLDCGKGGAK